MQVKVYYFRDYENFIQRYGYDGGTRRYRDITCPLDESFPVWAVWRNMPDHVLVATLEYTGTSTDPKAIAEWVFMVMNSFTQNPLSAGYGLGDIDPETLPADEIARRTAQNRKAVHDAGTAHTSMSVGDAVEIGGKLYVAASVGFVEVA